MKRIKEFVQWLNGHQDLALDLVRVYLGIGLLVRGFLFIGEPTTQLQQMLTGPEPGFMTAMLMHYIVLAHIAGGLLLTIGLLTRLAAIVQIPILTGAVFFVHVQEGLLATGQALEFSALVLFLLVVMALFGAGRWSADYYLFRNEEAPSFDDLFTNSVARGRTAREVDAVSAGGSGRNVTAEARASRPAARRQRLQRGASVTLAERCTCGHGLNHPSIVAEPHYGWLAGFRFMLGISAPVKEVSLYCAECGTVLQKTREPQALHKYRWHTS